MKNFFLVFFFAVSTLITSTNSVFAASLFNFNDPTGCQTTDPFLPTLVICGRNSSTNVCPGYTNPCNLSDLLETGRRILIWIISIVLMVLPVVIAYYGALMIIYRKTDVGGFKWGELKEKILWLIVYFVCLLGAWIIVRTIVDLAQVNPRINTFLIERGQQVKARNFDFSR
jgi:hypothetical protein